MKILTRENATEMVCGKPLDVFLSELSGRLRLVGDIYSIPQDSGRKTALSRLFAYMLLRTPNVCIYVSGWVCGDLQKTLTCFTDTGVPAARLAR